MHGEIPVIPLAPAGQAKLCTHTIPKLNMTEQVNEHAHVHVASVCCKPVWTVRLNEAAPLQAANFVST